MNVAGHLIHGDHLASLLISCVKCERRFSAWTRRAQTAVQAAETVFATRPFGERELAGAAVVGGFADVSAILLVVKPLACVGAGVGLTVDVFDCDAGRWVDGETWGALFVFTELLLSVGGFDLYLQCAYLELAEDVGA